MSHLYPIPNGAHPQTLGESLWRSSPLWGASSERGMTASSPWIWTRGTSGCRSSRPCSVRWNRLMAILLFGYGGRVKGPPRGLMVFLGILSEGLLEIYDAANSWNPTNERN